MKTQTEKEQELKFTPLEFETAANELKFVVQHS